MNASPLWTLPDLIQALSISERHARHLIFTKSLPVIRVGRLLRFDPDQIAAWLDERTETPAEVRRDA